MRRQHVPVVLIIMAILLNACAFGASPPETSNTTPATSSGATPASDSGATPADTTPAADLTNPSAPSAAERVTITFGSFEDSRTFYQDLINKFEKDNPEIEVRFVALDSIAGNISPFEALHQIMSTVDTTEWPGTAQAISNGWVRDLAPLMQADATFDRSDFYPGALESVSKDNGIYLLPRALHIPMLFYNKALWKARGLPDPKPDWTWNDVKAAAEQLVQRNGDKIEVYGMVDWHELLAIPGELQAAGITFDPDNPPRLDDPRVAQGVEQVVDLIKSGAVYALHTPGSARLGPAPNDDRITEMIRNQQIAMFSPDLGGYNPATFTPPFETGEAPFPMSVFSYFSSVDGYSMSSGTQHPEAAWRWLSFLSHQDYTAPDQIHFGVNTLPARKSSADHMGYWQTIGPENSAALTAVLNSPVAKQLVNTVPPDLRIDTDQLLDEIVGGGMPIAQALHAEQERLDSLLAQAPPTPTPERIVVATPVPGAPQGATTITFGTQRRYIDQIRQMATAFNQNNPGVFVDIKDTATDRGPQPLADVANTTDCFADFSPPIPDPAKNVLDLQPLIDADANFQLDDYPPALLAPFKNGTELYGLPYVVDFRVLNYNQTAFDAADLAHPTATWTLDDFLNAAQRLTSTTGKVKQYGFASPAFQTPDIFFFLDRLNAPPTTGSGDAEKPNFTDPKVVQALKTYIDLLRNDSPHQRLQSYARNADVDDVAHDDILNGQVGMWFDFGTSFLGEEQNADKNFTRAIAPPPLGGDAVTTNDFLVRGLYISAKTQQRDACWNWIKYLGNNLGALAGGFPARSSLAESNDFAQQALPGAADVYKAYHDALEKSGDQLEQTGATQVDYYWFFRAIDHAMQGKDLERELADAQTLTEQFLVCVRGGAPGSDCATQVDSSYQGRANAPPAATP